MGGVDSYPTTFRPGHMPQVNDPSANEHGNPPRTTFAPLQDSLWKNWQAGYPEAYTTTSRYGAYTPQDDRHSHYYGARPARLSTIEERTEPASQPSTLLYPQWSSSPQYSSQGPGVWVAEPFAEPLHPVYGGAPDGKAAHGLPYSNGIPPIPDKPQHNSACSDPVGYIAWLVYNGIMLWLPSLYLYRVAGVFSALDSADIRWMGFILGSRSLDSILWRQGRIDLPPVYETTMYTWETFIGAMIEEWKTFNFISSLLLTAIWTVLQIDAAAKDGVIRYTAIASLVCALISLMYGCLYVVWFDKMRKPWHASEWAEESRKDFGVIWNVWVFLAMPAIWLCWSILLFIACIVSYIWRTSTADIEHPPLTENTLFAARMSMTALLILGFIYGTLSVYTFRRYGEKMDRQWIEGIKSWIQERLNRNLPPLPIEVYPQPTILRPHPPRARPSYSGYNSTPYRDYHRTSANDMVPPPPTPYGYSQEYEPPRRNWYSSKTQKYSAPPQGHTSPGRDFYNKKGESSDDEYDGPAYPPQGHAPMGRSFYGKEKESSEYGYDGPAYPPQSRTPPGRSFDKKEEYSDEENVGPSIPAEGHGPSLRSIYDKEEELSDGGHEGSVISPPPCISQEAEENDPPIALCPPGRPVDAEDCDYVSSKGYDNPVVRATTIPIASPQANDSSVAPLPPGQSIHTRDDEVHMSSPAISRRTESDGPHVTPLPSKRSAGKQDKSPASSTNRRRPTTESESTRSRSPS
ncbi:hypothetical protein CC1G_07741 [Coprinopsis cinerea okayama7|uniref:Transmembrane protein n=1 Tax=Coprinopsis cinerea (strain Okayama-7 / 130 / ATCC MYA-4618 / FGSC 9003) TaxID=240176 RepID=A8NBZ7_COPC7|nr:hypothetical protein CC1G_07741 [Coprinopsis cinerea okayama7\|eukprot:XP_001832354.2 hypothetical protein CC1G_07741 [Coprinopsis cinerea okayama7\